jgi:hypothetical protein
MVSPLPENWFPNKCMTNSHRGGLTDVLWNLSLAINVYLTVYKRYSSDQLRRLEFIYILLNYGVTFILALFPVFVSSSGKGRMYGSASYWCWFSTKWDFLRLVLMYAPVWFSILSIFTMYCLAGHKIYKKRKELQSLDSRRSNKYHRRSGRSSTYPQTKTTEVKVVYENSNDDTKALVGDPEHHADKRSHPHTSLTNEFGQYSVSVQSGAGAFEMHDSSHTTDPQTLSSHRSVANQQNALFNRAAAAYTKRAVLFFCALLITWVSSFCF